MDDTLQSRLRYRQHENSIVKNFRQSFFSIVSQNSSRDDPLF